VRLVAFAATMRPDGAVGSRDDVSSRDTYGMILDDAAGGHDKSPGENSSGQWITYALETFRDGAAPVSVLVSFAEVRGRTRRTARGRNSRSQTTPTYRERTSADWRVELEAGRHLGTGEPPAACAPARAPGAVQPLFPACNWRATLPLPPAPGACRAGRRVGRAGCGIMAHDTSIVTISGEQPDDQASPAARPHHRLRQPEPTVTT